jgi:hypothetical protein
MRPSRLLALTASLVLVLSVLPATAQEWRQEIELITPVAFDGPTHLLLDSLDARLSQSPALRVRRAPDEPALSYTDLREALYADGVDLRSASHALLRYRFDLAEQGVGVVETLESLTFIFRVDESRVDLPIVHLDTRSPVVSALLTESGRQSPVNMRSITPFRTLVSYPYLSAHQETDLVAFGDQTIREGLPLRQMAVLDLLEEHMIMGTYRLDTAPERLAAVTP